MTVGGDIRPATSAPIDPGFASLVNPTSIAVIGASSRSGHFGNNPFVHLRGNGFAGRVYPVNPHYPEIAGWRCYPSLSDLPEVPDLAAITLAGPAALSVLEDCAALGVKAAVVVASEFGETGDVEGAERQRRLRDIARSSGMRVLGPNCLGIANFNSGAAALVSGNIPASGVGPGAIAIVSQSGGCGLTIVNRAWRLGVSVGHLATTGNEADVTLPELVEVYLNDSDVRVVLCYMEAVRDASRLRDVAAISSDAGKPVFIMKAGATRAGERAAAAHTGALATSDAAFDAALRQWGLFRARSFDALVAAGALAAQSRAPASGRLGVYAQGGGLAVVAADAISERGLALLSPAGATVERLKELMPDTTPGNPFDSGGRFFAGGAALLEEGLTTFAADPNFDVIVYWLTTIAGHRVSVYADGIARAAKACSKPTVVLQYSGGTLSDEATTILRSAGLVTLDPPETALDGLALWLSTGGRDRSAGMTVTRRSGDVAARARDLVLRWRAEGIERVTQGRAWELFELYGLPLARQMWVSSAAEAARAADMLDSPVAVKLESPDVPHRSDIGCVILGVHGGDAAADAFETVMARGRDRHPAARLEGGVVSEMARPGLELIAGVKIDLAFGPLVMVGLGGVFAEALRDVSVRLAPITDELASEMLEELAGARLLKGFRGSAGVEVAVIADVLARLGELARDLQDVITAVDLNPLIVHSAGDAVVIVDALVEL